MISSFKHGFRALLFVFCSLQVWTCLLAESDSDSQEESIWKIKKKNKKDEHGMKQKCYEMSPFPIKNLSSFYLFVSFPSDAMLLFAIGCYTKVSPIQQNPVGNFKEKLLWISEKRFDRHSVLLCLFRLINCRTHLISLATHTKSCRNLISTCFSNLKSQFHRKNFRQCRTSQNKHHRTTYRQTTTKSEVFDAPKHLTPTQTGGRERKVTKSRTSEAQKTSVALKPCKIANRGLTLLKKRNSQLWTFVFDFTAFLDFTSLLVFLTSRYL